MPARERPRWALLAGVTALGALLVTALALVELLVDAPSRGTAARLVAGTVLALAAHRVRAVAKLGITRQPPSAFDLDGRRARIADPEPSRFHELDAEVRAAARQRRHFEAVLWPHLVALAEAGTSEPATWLVKPPGRSFGRGPDLAAIERLVAAIEARR
jgi:hypothetical protein